MVAERVGRGRGARDAVGSAAPGRALEWDPWMVSRLDQRCNVQAQAAGLQGSAQGQQLLLGCRLESGPGPQP